MEYNKDLLEIRDFEVIVVGGGPAGCAAAISSARRGVKTLLIEETYVLGGMGTIGLVPTWCPYSDKEKIIYRGIAEEVFDKSKQYFDESTKKEVDWVPIDAEALKEAYDELVITSGAEVLFGTVLVDVKRVEDKIEALIVSNDEGMFALYGKIFIDCTGDADIIYYGKGEYEGYENEIQPSTLCFNLSNFNYLAYLKENLTLDSYNKESKAKLITEDEEFDMIYDNHLGSKLIGPNTIAFNAGHVKDVDSLNPKSLSEGIIAGRKLVHQLVKAFNKYYPNMFKNVNLVTTASVIGNRESRRIVGDYKLTIDDYATRASFFDEIGRACYYIDVHGNRDAAIPKGKLEPYNKGDSYGIPYRTLLPKGFKNVLVAGKTISCDRMVQGSVRIMPACLVTGEAAGVAASLALRDSDTRKVSISELRDILKKNNAFFY